METKLQFALAGQIVDTSKQARKILVDSITTGKEWLIPQAESVYAKLKQAGQ